MEISPEARMEELKRVAKPSERLKEALYCSRKRQVDVSRETGIDKASISNYVKGRYEPKFPAIKKLAKALHVAETWLWGFDVPRERVEAEREMMGVTPITSCEDPSTVYYDFPDIRLVFRDGKYVGWYATGADER